GAPPAASTDAPTLAATVEHVEWLGHETLAYLRLAGAGEALRMIARLPGMLRLEAGRDVRVALDPEAIHFFGADGTALR
ncbi:MAG TPA: TOBE domain-containing protein, partial [Candidatus Binatia bacterium]